MDLKSQLAQLSAYMEEQKENISDVNMDCIYNYEPLGFEYCSIVSNDMYNRNKKFEV